MYVYITNHNCICCNSNFLIGEFLQYLSNINITFIIRMSNIKNIHKLYIQNIIAKNKKFIGSFIDFSL